MTYRVTTVWQKNTDADVSAAVSAEGFRKDFLEQGLSSAQFVDWVGTRNLVGWDSVKDDIKRCFEIFTESFNETEQTYTQIVDWDNKDLYDGFRAYIQQILDDPDTNYDIDYCSKVSVNKEEI